jgi:vitamin B12 transporter
VLSSLSFVSPATSQQAPVVELEPVVVTASALPQRPEDTSASVTTIGKDEIRRMQANRVAEVLSQIPGLHVDEMGSRGGISSVYIRGGDPNFTLIMIDGIPINDPMNPRGGSVDLSNLMPEHIDRIEIVRGPMSSLYGSDAMAGAINIITRRGKAETSYDFLAEGGSFGYVRGVLGTSGTLQRTKYAALFSFNRTDEQVKKDRFNTGSVAVNLDLLESKNLSLRLTNQYTKTATRAFPEGSGGPRLAILRDTEERETHEVVTGIHLSLRGNHRWQQELTSGLFYRTQAVDSPGVQVTNAVFQIPPATFDTNYARYQFLWKHLFQVASNWSLAAGTQLTYENGVREGLQKLTALGAPDDLRSNFAISRFTPAVIFETNIAPAKDVRITTGFRLDVPESARSEFSPKLGLLYRPYSTTELRLNVGRGFKLPSFNALGDPLIGNRNLKPETSIGADLGIEQGLFKNQHTVGITYFYNRFSDLIDLDPDLAQQGVFRLVNLSTVETQGIESNVKIRATDSLRMKGYFTYLHSDIKGTDQPLRNRPKFSGGVVFDSEWFEQLLLRLDVNLVGKKFDLQVPTRRNTTAGYARANLTITYAPTKTWRLFGVVENLTNTSYEDYIGFRRPGVAVRGGFRIQM